MLSEFVETTANVPLVPDVVRVRVLDLCYEFLDVNLDGNIANIVVNSPGWEQCYYLANASSDDDLRVRRLLSTRGSNALSTS